MLLSPPFIVAYFIVVICLLITGLVALKIMRRKDQNPSQWKFIKDMYTESGVNPITGNKFTHTHTENSQVRV